MTEKICFDRNSVSSVHDFQVKGTFRIFTETFLSDLLIDNECQCEGEPVKPVLPLELVFVIDGSDSFNQGVRNQRGLIEKEASFKYTCEWVANFVKSINPSHYPAVVVSVFQFSGQKSHEARYKPGSGGLASTSIDGVKDWHYKTILKPTLLRPNMSTVNLVDTIKKQEQLDSNCQLFLCLQDLGMSNFLAQMDQAVPRELGATAVERAMIILTNGNNWDLNTLKRWDEPSVVTDKARVAALLSKSYNNVVPICVQDEPLDPEAKQFVSSKLSKPRNTGIVVENNKFFEQLAAAKTALLQRLKLN